MPENAPSSESNQPEDPSRDQRMNVPGLVGFLLSLTGFLGFCMTPFFLLGTIGMGVSIIGLFRVPRTLAVAGVVIGLGATIMGLVLAPPAPGTTPAAP